MSKYSAPCIPLYKLLLFFNFISSYIWTASRSSEILNSDLVIEAGSAGPLNMHITSMIFLSDHVGKCQKPPNL